MDTTENDDEDLNESDTSTDTVITREPKKVIKNKKKKQKKPKQTQLTDNTQERKSTLVIRGNEQLNSGSVNSFSAAAKRAWIYVGRTRADTTPQQVNNYLTNKYDGYEFIVEALPKREDASSISFKVGPDITLLNDLYKPENWPKDVLIKKFEFFRHKKQRQFNN